MATITASATTVSQGYKGYDKSNSRCSRRAGGLAVRFSAYRAHIDVVRRLIGAFDVTTDEEINVDTEEA